MPMMLWGSTTFQALQKTPEVAKFQVFKSYVDEGVEQEHISSLSQNKEVWSQIKAKSSHLKIKFNLKKKKKLKLNVQVLILNCV